MNNHTFENIDEIKNEEKLDENINIEDKKQVIVEQNREKIFNFTKWMLLISFYSTLIFILIAVPIIRLISKNIVFPDWFLSILMGSQLLFLPFSLMGIITKFYFSDKNKK